MNCNHDAARHDAFSFKAMTVRLRHMPDREAYWELGGSMLWLRDCPCCHSTLSMKVTANVA